VNSIELVGDGPSSHFVLCLPGHKVERNRTAVVNLLRCMRYGVIDLWTCGYHASWCLKAPATRTTVKITVLFHFI
jgi:hypothetical protein